MDPLVGFVYTTNLLLQVILSCLLAISSVLGRNLLVGRKSKFLSNFSSISHLYAEIYIIRPRWSCSSKIGGKGNSWPSSTSHRFVDYHFPIFMTLKEAVHYKWLRDRASCSLLYLNPKDTLNFNNRPLGTGNPIKR